MSSLRSGRWPFRAPLQASWSCAGCATPRVIRPWRSDAWRWRRPFASGSGAWTEPKTYPVQLQLESIVFKDRHIPNFSALVTAMFTAELKNQLLTAGHDFDSLKFPVTLRVADGTESFTLITGAEQGLKAGDMYMSDTAGIISVVVYGPDERTRITPETRNAVFTVYVPPGVNPTAAQAHLKDIRDNVLLVAPEAALERLEVYQA